MASSRASSKQETLRLLEEIRVWKLRCHRVEKDRDHLQARVIRMQEALTPSRTNPLPPEEASEVPFAGEEPPATPAHRTMPIGGSAMRRGPTTRETAASGPHYTPAADRSALSFGGQWLAAPSPISHGLNSSSLSSSHSTELMLRRSAASLALTAVEAREHLDSIRSLQVTASRQASATLATTEACLAEIRALSASHRLLVDEVVNLRDTVGELQSEARQPTITREGEEGGLQSRIAALEEENAEVTTYMEQLRDAMRDLLQENDALDAKVKEREEQIRALESHVVQLDTTLRAEEAARESLGLGGVSIRSGGSSVAEHPVRDIRGRGRSGTARSMRHPHQLQGNAVSSTHV